MRGNSHVRCGVGENLEITSKSYLSLSFEMIATAMESKRLGLCTKSLFAVAFLSEPVKGKPLTRHTKRTIDYS